MSDTCDVLIAGAGIVGLSTAQELHRRGVKRIVLLEKESALGAHASGRNSGVLHAGIYYSTDSLKARFCSRGAKLMKEYARARGLEVLTVGKVIVASSEGELPALAALLDRAAANEIRAEKIDAERLREIEPTARTVRWALYSPDTAVVDPQAVLETLRQDLLASGVRIALSEPIVSIASREQTVRTPKTTWSYGHLINTAGLHADRLAHMMGTGLKYRILPFRGRYKKLKAAAAGTIRGLIYPVPDSRLPFLGVHLTKSVHGDVWVGPTAEPTLGREHYGGWGGIRWPELPRLLADLASMALVNASGLASHLEEEFKKQVPGGLARAAQRLVPTLRSGDFSAETKVGLRAQLLDIQTKQLVMDFVVEKGPSSTHVLNAVSPGFTASFAFAEYIAGVALDASKNSALPG